MTFTLSPTAVPGRVGAYARLAKLDVWDYYLAFPLAWAAAGPAAWTDPAVAATLALLALGAVGVVAGAVALDDVTGFRDGSDAANYGPDTPARKLARKPLLTGEITERDAVRFAWVAAGAGALLWGLAAAAAPFSPQWTLVVLAVCAVTAVQYSWGAKISYRGGQELFLAGFGAGLVLAALGLVAGEVTAFAAVQAALFGLGPLLFGVYSNTRDAEADAAVGRRTVAAVLPPAGNRAFIAFLTVAEIALIVIAAGLGVAPWWFSLAMLPAMAMRVAQLRRGVGLGDLLGARLLGLYGHRATVALLIVVDLYAVRLGPLP